MSAAPHMPCAMTPWKRVEAANSASMCCGLMSPDIAAKSWMSDAVSVRSMLARSPTLISSKVRLRRTSRSEEEKVLVMRAPRSGHVVQAGVDVDHVAGHGGRSRHGEERDHPADLGDVHQALRRRALHRHVDQLVEVRDAARGARAQRPGRHGEHADPARAELL